MAYLLTTIANGYNDLMQNKSDPRVNDWFLMSSPLPTFLICISYVYGVKVLGPRLMENRKPFEMKNILIIYNLFQVLFSSYLFYESAVTGWLTNYSFKCQPVDYSRAPMPMRMARGCWWYYISKFTEFMDTVFFVLRKKNDHVSTLHVIHHGVMPLSVWFGVKFTPGGHSTFFGFLNTFVHIIMYTYYLVAALGPQYHKYLWWKKYLTTIQMVQFVLVMVHAFQLLFIDCNYPKAFVWWIGMHSVMFYFLFSNFYKETYVKNQRRKMLSKNGIANGKCDDGGIDDHQISNGKANGFLHKNTYGVFQNSVDICFPTQSSLYDNGVKEVPKGYTASDKLRHRAFVSTQEST